MAEIMSKIGNYVILFTLIGCTMFLVSGSFVQEYTLPKIYCFIFCSSFLFLLTLLSNNKSFKSDRITIILFLFVAYLIVHSVIFPARCLNVVILLNFLLLYIYFKQNEQIAGIFVTGTITVICFFQSLYGLAQYFGLFYSASSFSVTGSFDNPAGFSACLAIGFPFVLGLLQENRTLKVLGVVSILLIITVIVLSESRTGIVCITLVLFVYTYHKFIKKYIRLKKLILILLTVWGVIFLTYLVYLKKDSASGRLLIWEVTLNMIKNNPILGQGGGSFGKYYMLYQAEYFEIHPHSQYSILADNVYHPFNEYLLLTSEYGVIGLFLLICCIVIILKSKINILSPGFLSLLSIVVFSCFSYPLKYPFVWVLLAFCLSHLAKENQCVFIFHLKKKVIISVYIAVMLLASLVVFKDIQFEYKWKKTVKLSSLGKTYPAINNYENLYSSWNQNPLFLYNYGAELNHIKEYSKSIAIIHECEIYFNDYDVQMLLADNYYQLNNIKEAEKRYYLASNMCPNRFLPLYWMMKIYDEKGQSEEAKKIAEIIINKEIKIPSATITKIQVEARKRIDCKM